jgi:hypothetical protein
MTIGRQGDSAAVSCGSAWRDRKAFMALFVEPPLAGAYAWRTHAPVLYSRWLGAAGAACAAPSMVRASREQPIDPSEQTQELARGR